MLHIKGVRSLFIIATALVVLPLAVQAEDSFSKDGVGASRTPAELYGGQVSDVDIAADGRFYAALNSPNGIFTSTDAGQTWQSPNASSDLGQVLQVEVSDETNTAYIIAGIGLHKTTNAGATWTDLSTASETATGDYDHALGYENGVLVAAARDGSVDVSTDEGVSFSNVSVLDGGSVTSIVGTADGSTFYMLAGEEQNSESRTFHQLNVDTVTIATSSITGNYSNVGVDPTNSNRIIVAGPDGALISTSGFNGVFTELTTDSVVGHVNFIGDRIFIGSNYTDDNGSSWGSIDTSGETGSVNGTLLAVDPSDDNTWLVSGDYGTALTTDFGETWSYNDTGILAIRVNGIAQSVDKADVWLALQGGLAHSGNYTSDDQTWDYPVDPDDTGAHYFGIWVNPVDSNHVLAGGGALTSSSDGGETWTELLEPFGEAGEDQGRFSGIVSTNDGTTIYTSFQNDDSETGTVYRSTDSGATWEDLSLGIRANVVALLGDGTPLVGVGPEGESSIENRGIYSYDGSDWTQVTTAESQTVSDILVVGTTVYAAGMSDQLGGVHRSTDNGTTWEFLDDNGLDTGTWYLSLAVEPNNSNALYTATGRPTGQGTIYKSTNGGDDWFEIYAGLKDEHFYDMLFDGLIAASTTGAYNVTSKVKLTFKAKKNIVKRGEKAVLTATLKDKATSKVLKRKVLKLYTKKKPAASWNRIKIKASKSKTSISGKKVYKRVMERRRFFQVRWKPTGNDAEIYGDTALRSKRVRVRVKQ